MLSCSHMLGEHLLSPLYYLCIHFFFLIGHLYLSVTVHNMGLHVAGRVMCDQTVTSVRPRVFLTFALLSSCCVSEYIMDCWSSVPSKPRRAEKVNNMQASHLQTCWQKECDIKNCHCWMKIYLYAYDLLMCKFSLIKVHHSFMWKDRPFLVNFGSTLCWWWCISFTLLTTKLLLITKPQGASKKKKKRREATSAQPL